MRSPRWLAPLLSLPWLAPAGETRHSNSVTVVLR